MRVVFISTSTCEEVDSGKHWLSCSWLAALEECLSEDELDRIHVPRRRESGLLRAMDYAARVIGLAYLLPGVWLQSLVTAFRPVLRERSAIREADLVVVDHFGLGWLVPLLGATGSGPVCFIAHNAEARNRASYLDSAPPFDRLIARLELPALRYWERRVTEAAGGVACVNAREREWLEEADPDARVVTVYPPAWIGDELEEDGRSERLRGTGAGDEGFELLYVGSFGYRAKRLSAEHFVRSVMPRIRGDGQAVRLTIVGNDSEDVLGGTGPDWLRICGRVEEVAPYYRTADAAVVPEPIGGGFKLKVLEAMIERVPIIAHPKAVEGMGLVAGRHYLAAETADEWRSAVEELRGQRGRAARLVETAHEKAVADHSFSHFSASVRELVREIGRSGD